MNEDKISSCIGMGMVYTFKLPSLSIPQAIGLAMIVEFLAKNQVKTDDAKNKSWGEIIGQFLGTSIFVPLFVVGIGYLVAGLL